MSSWTKDCRCDKTRTKLKRHHIDTCLGFFWTQIIRTQTREILSESTFEEVDYTTLVVILSQDEINADESTLFDAMVRWAGKECERRALDPKSQKRTVLKDALFLVRYLTFAPAEFAAGPAR